LGSTTQVREDTRISHLKLLNHNKAEERAEVGAVCRYLSTSPTAEPKQPMYGI